MITEYQHYSLQLDNTTISILMINGYIDNLQPTGANVVTRNDTVR